MFEGEQRRVGADPEERTRCGAEAGDSQSGCWEMRGTVEQPQTFPQCVDFETASHCVASAALEFTVVQADLEFTVAQAALEFIVAQAGLRFTILLQACGMVDMFIMMATLWFDGKIERMDLEALKYKSQL